jgi:hypothetical protein
MLCSGAAEEEEGGGGRRRRRRRRRRRGGFKNRNLWGLVFGLWREALGQQLSVFELSSTIWVCKAESGSKFKRSVRGTVERLETENSLNTVNRVLTRTAPQSLWRPNLGVLIF